MACLHTWIQRRVWTPRVTAVELDSSLLFHRVAAADPFLPYSLQYCIIPVDGKPIRIPAVSRKTQTQSERWKEGRRCGGVPGGAGGAVESFPVKSEMCV